MNLSMSSPNLTEAEIKAVCEVLETRHLSLGPKLHQFEEAVAIYNGATYGIGVNSGTSGLHLCIIASRVGDGDLVIRHDRLYAVREAGRIREEILPPPERSWPEMAILDEMATAIHGQAESASSGRLHVKVLQIVEAIFCLASIR